MSEFKRLCTLRRQYSRLLTEASKKEFKERHAGLVIAMVRIEKKLRRRGA